METLYYGIEHLTDFEQKKLGAAGLGKTNDTKNAYEIITERIIKIIESSKELPWRKPWSLNSSGEPNIPLNYSSKRPYSGVNAFLLSMEMLEAGHSCPYFLTFKQILDLKGSVRKGAKAYLVCFYTSDIYRHLTTKKTISKSAWENLPFSEKEKYEPSFTLRYYTAFNAADIEGIKFDESWKPKSLKEPEKIESCEAILANMPNKPPIYQKPQDSAFYTPSKDTVTMPLMSYFEREPDFYSTLFHELIHATGSPSRLDREEKKKRTKFGDSFYAFEELIAEMGACYLCGEAGILYHTLKNSAAYIQSWKKSVVNYLADDPKFFFKASADAQRGADYILGKSDPSVYAKFKPMETAEKPAKTKTMKPKVDKSDTIKKLKAEASQLKLKVISNSKFKEKLSTELRNYLSENVGLSGKEISEETSIKKQIQFYKRLLKGDDSDFKVIAKRVGLTYQNKPVRKRVNTR